MTSNVIKLPPLLERLGSMTAIRDTELLEQSLLKALGARVNVPNASAAHRIERQVDWPQFVQCILTTTATTTGSNTRLFVNPRAIQRAHVRGEEIAGRIGRDGNRPARYVHTSSQNQNPTIFRIELLLLIVYS